MSIGRQRFSLAYELYHLYFDETGRRTVSLIHIGEGEKNEERANQFASYFLIPPSSLYEQIKKIEEQQKKNG